MCVSKIIQVTLSDTAVYNILGLFLSGPQLSNEVIVDRSLLHFARNRKKTSDHCFLAEGCFLLLGQLCWTSLKKWTFWATGGGTKSIPFLSRTPAHKNCYLWGWIKSRLSGRTLAHRFRKCLEKVGIFRHRWTENRLLGIDRQFENKQMVGFRNLNI